MGGASIPAEQDALYQDAAQQFGPSLARLARAYEADAEKRRDLSQNIHFQLWLSFRRYEARCSLKTWVYRIAHHVAASHVIRERRVFSTLVSLEQLEMLPDKAEGPEFANQRLDLDRLASLIQRLKPLDRQVIVCSTWKTWTRRPSERSRVCHPETLPFAFIELRRSWLAVSRRERIMRDEPGDDVRGIWQNQPAETHTMTLKLIQSKARELRAKTRRQLRGTLGAPLAAALCYFLGTRLFPSPPPVMQVLFASALAWSLLGLYFLTRGMWSREMPSDAGLSTSLEFCRQELARRDRILRGALLWSFGPILLAIGALILGLAMAGTKERGILPNGLPFLVLVVVWIMAYLVIRLRERRGLQHELELLNEIDQENRKSGA